MAEIVPDANGYYHLGPHRFRFDVPDVLHMHFNGNVEPQHFEQFYETALHLIPDRNRSSRLDCCPSEQATITDTVISIVLYLTLIQIDKNADNFWRLATHMS